MSYRIYYPAVRKLRGRERLRCRLPALTALCFLIFWMMVSILWPDGAQALQSFFVSVQNCIPVSLLDGLALQLLKADGVALLLTDSTMVFAV